MTRTPIVSGSFYPGNKDTLIKDLNKYLGDKRESQKALGVISPHAGYVYSGSVMGSVFSSIEIPDTIVILAPNHTGRGAMFSVWPGGGWKTPFGEVSIDNELVNELLGSCVFLEKDKKAHTQEHSAEVILPFLQYLNPNIKIAVIVFKQGTIADLMNIGKSIGQVLNKIRPSTLVVASSDMTHYEDHQSASNKDKSAIDEILELKEEGLYNIVKQLNITMCGVHPAISMISCSKERGATKAHLTRYTTSGDVSGDYNHVVGYAGIIIQ